MSTLIRSYDPVISVRWNILQSFLAISLVYIVTIKYGLVGTALGMLGAGLRISGFWYLELSKYDKKNIRH